MFCTNFPPVLCLYSFSVCKYIFLLKLLISSFIPIAIKISSSVASVSSKESSVFRVKLKSLILSKPSFANTSAKVSNSVWGGVRIGGRSWPNTFSETGSDSKLSLVSMVSYKSESTWDVVIKVGFFKALSIRRTLSLITKVVVKKKNKTDMNKYNWPGCK